MAAPLTETAISSRARVRRRTWALVLTTTALGLVAAGCGYAAGPAHTVTTARTATAARTASFAWVRPAALPSGWGVVHIAAGASLAYPPRWRPVHSDPGTASRVLVGPGGQFIGYLNLTPRTANEPLAGWARFRVDHNGEEHDRDVRALASAQGLRFTSATGSCVRDSYTTKSSARYVEIACLVVGHRTGVVSHPTGVVVIAAAPPQYWPHIASELERAVNSVRI